MAPVNRQEIEDFYDRSPHRGIAVSLGALVENRLTSYLQTAMRPDRKVINDLFQPSGPLANFGTKIRLTYMLGLIAPETFKDLLIISKIRNEFAHKPSVRRLDQPPIKQWVEQTHIYSTLCKMRDADPSTRVGDPKFKDVLHFVLTQQLDVATTPDGPFRECVRMYLGHLQNLEDKFRAEARPLANAGEPSSKAETTQPPSASPEKSE